MFVYCAVHLESGRIYVGKTYDFAHRYETHLKAARGNSKAYFHNALRKYGYEAFSWTILERFHNDDVAAASEAEKRWIRFWGSNDPKFGFNMTLGGDGVHPTKEVRQKMSLSQRLRFQTESKEEKQQRIARHVTGAVNIRGTKNPVASLTQDQLSEVRRQLLIDSSGTAIKRLANTFNVSYKTIQRIKHGNTYNDMPSTST